jgi:hypothetical protein
VWETIERYLRGVLILLKALRKAIGINEGEVIAEAKENMIKPLKPKVVKMDQCAIEELLSGEKRFEEEKLRNFQKYT